MKLLIPALALACATFTPIASAGPDFKLVLLAPPAGGTSSGANDINASGAVVGWFNTAGGTHGFRWMPSTPAGDTGSAVKLGSYPGCNMSCDAEALRINAHGHAVGYARAADGSNRAVLWPASGTSPIDLGLLPGYTGAVAHDINDDGVVVGKALGSVVPTTVGFRWTPSVPNGTSGTLEQLPGLSGAVNSAAHAINNAGTIAGESTKPWPDGTHAVRWSAAGLTDLEFGFGFQDSVARAVNSSGLIFGYYAGLAGLKLAHGFATSPMGTGTTIGTLPGKRQSKALDANGPGHVVGDAYRNGEDNQPLAFLWTSSKGIRDLNTLIPLPSSTELRFARGINDDRRIVGEAYNGSAQAFLLIPTAFAHDKTPWIAAESRPYLDICDPLRICQLVRVTNIGAKALAGPLQIVLDRLGGVPGLANAAGTYREAPFVSVPVPSLAPGAAVDVRLIFDRQPNGGQPSYQLQVYAGEF